MSADAAQPVSVAGSWESRVKRFLQPAPVLMLIYFGYFAVVYSGFWRYAYWELMGLNTGISGFLPSPQTVLLYIYAAVVLVFGFVLGLLVVRRRELVAGPLAPALARAGAVAGGVLRRRSLWFRVAMAGWAVGFAATAAQWVASGGASLTDIGTRWYQSPIIVFIAMSQIFTLPMLVITAERPWQRWVAGALFVVSVLGLAMLGARNIPAKAIVATFVAVVYAVKPRNLARIAVTLALVLGLAMGFVGAFSKAGIYGTSASGKLVLALTYSDSVGTVFNLDRIVRMTPPTTGAYHGSLLSDSIKAGIPRNFFSGRKPDYANFQLGRYLGGRQYFVVGGSVINQGVSLAPTMLGAAYADLGVPGVILQMALVGFLLGYLQMRARAQSWLVPSLALFASFVINGVNVGLHNPHAIAATAAAVLVAVIDIVAGRAVAVGRV